MPTISDMSYGFDSAGVASYLDAIQDIVLEKAKIYVEDIFSIKTVCEANWEGTARDEFLVELQTMANHVGEQFQALYNGLTTEINNISSAMNNFDDSLIK